MLIFDKSGTGSAELKGLIGWLFKSNSFDSIGMDLELAQEELAGVVGDDVVSRALVHYHSVNYSVEEPTPEMVFNDLLVKYVQLPIALMGYKSFSENADVSHEDSGRKVKIDSESEKLPWEWMLDRDNQAMVRKASKATDRLIAFLDSNVDAVTEWKDSEQRSAMNDLFVRSAKEFNDVYPINRSRSFFVRVLPFVKEVERKFVKPVLGSELFDTLKTERLAGSFSEGHEELFEMVCDAVPLLVMSVAMKRLSVEVLPEGVFQSLISDRLTTQGKAVPMSDMIVKIAAGLERDGRDVVSALASKVEVLCADPDAVVDVLVEPVNDVGNKFFTV